MFELPTWCCVERSISWNRNGGRSYKVCALQKKKKKFWAIFYMYINLFKYIHTHKYLYMFKYVYLYWLHMHIVTCSFGLLFDHVTITDLISYFSHKSLCIAWVTHRLIDDIPPKKNSYLHTIEKEDNTLKQWNHK